MSMMCEDPRTGLDPSRSSAGPKAALETLLRDLLARTAGGDPDALAALYDQTAGLVHALALRLCGDGADADEVTVEIFEEVWRKAAQYDLSRGGVRTWLMVMTRSKSIDRRRSQEVRERHTRALVDSDRPSADLVDRRDPGDDSIDADRAMLVSAALAQLAPAQRDAIEASFFKDMTHHQVAETLGVPLGTAKSNIRRGLSQMRAVLSSLEEEL